MQNPFPVLNHLIIKKKKAKTNCLIKTSLMWQVLKPKNVIIRPRLPLKTYFKKRENLKVKRITLFLLNAKLEHLEVMNIMRIAKWVKRFVSIN